MEAVGRGGRDKEESSAGLTLFAALSEQCVLGSDQSRSMEYRPETIVVTRIGANTTPIHNNKT